MPIKDTWSVVQKSKLHTLRIAVVIFTVFTVGRGGGAELWRCETSRAETGVCGHKIARTAQPPARHLCQEWWKNHDIKNLLSVKKPDDKSPWAAVFRVPLQGIVLFVIYIAALRDNKLH